ncbi:MAG TPA: hypothetical protein GX708_00235, partial [Gallicola sp.]|nr:hypothetical protein [Gallicola sp.]
MEVLKTYIENIFSSYKENEKSIRIKNDILTHMEDEYEDLILNGKSSEEAVGIIITKFGSFDELLSELELKNSNENISLSQEDLETVEEYKKFSTTFPIFISTGIIFYILAVGVTGGLSFMLPKSYLPFIFFSFIAIGTGLLAFAGIKKNYFIDYFKSKGLTQYYDVEEYGPPVDSKNKKYYRRKKSLDLFENIMWIIIVIIYLYLGFYKGLWHPGWIVFLIGAILSIIIKIIIEYSTNND